MSIIVGVGVVGVLQLLAAGSMANADSTELTTAVNLANNIDEVLQGANYTTLFATYDNVTYSPPVDGRGVALSNFSNWSQVIDVQYVEPTQLTATVADTLVKDTARVTVQIKHNNVVVYSTAWVVVAQ